MVNHKFKKVSGIMPRKVLIVEDIATNRIVLNVKLSSAGYDVVQATSAEAGLATALTTQPDVVLASARPDKMSPEQFLRAFGEHPQLAKLPVIMLMEGYNPAARLKLLKAGAADVMSHPPKIGALLARFRSILRRHDSREDALLTERMAQSLGFSEAPSGFVSAAQVSVTASAPTRAKAWCAALSTTPDCLIQPRDDTQLLNEHTGASPDVLVVEVQADAPEAGLCLLADLRAHPRTRDAGLVAVLDRPLETLYCDAMDRGADDVLPHGFCPIELGLRIRQLATHKKRNDHRRAYMHEGLRAAVTDPLTGLYNRRFAALKLAQTVADCEATGQSCAVMAIDVDHFKQVNDVLGHSAGDTALIELAALLQHSLRPEDLVARIGGEEFLVVMPHTHHGHAQEVANRLRAMIDAHPFHLASNAPLHHITVSIGVAVQEPCQHRERTNPPDRAEALIASADAALYRSKRHGRNQVTMSIRTAA